MYKVGYIDDENDLISDYIKRLERRDIELIVAPVGDMATVKKWIVDNNIECMLIDYQLKAEYEYVGTELFSYLYDELPGLPCIILTSFTDSSVNENTVVKNCIVDRGVMDKSGTEFDEFCDMLKQSTEVFKTNKNKYISKYTELYKKKSEGNILPEEEEELLTVFKILKSYGEVDDISAQLLKTKVDDALDAVLGKLDELLNK
ncbi:hypothetical protein HDR58_07075 [bacterium]|nr:hypothetical protein [bacterium]